ncbi:MAG: preprotein translocase subunit SecG [Spirochaetaceae bacterium]|nr:MAG: preprotein translocase subunit SecG [Spirochaetaceae bacterium]
MGFLSILLLIFFVLSALLLIALVMVQEEGGDGLGGIFGGGGASQVGNRSGNILTKTTSILGAVFFLSSFGVAWLNRTPDAGDVAAAARRMEQGDAVPWWEIEEGDIDSELDLNDLMSPEVFEETPSN